jgi:hypothetical protein
MACLDSTALDALAAGTLPDAERSAAREHVDG